MINNEALLDNTAPCDGNTTLPTLPGLDDEHLDQTQVLGVVLTESTSASDVTPVSHGKLAREALGEANRQQNSVHVYADRNDVSLKARMAVKGQLSTEQMQFDLVDENGRVIQSNFDLWQASSPSSCSAAVRAVPSEDAVEMFDRCADELQELRQRFVVQKLEHFERKIDAIVSDAAKERSLWQASEELKERSLWQALASMVDEKIKASQVMIDERIKACQVMVDERIKAGLAQTLQACREELFARKDEALRKELRNESERITELQKEMQSRFRELQARAVKPSPVPMVDDLLAKGGQQDESLRRESQRTTDLQNLLVTQSHSLASLSARQSSSQAIINQHAEAIRAQDVKTAELSEKLRLQGERLSESVYTALQRLGDGESSLFSALVDKLGALAEKFPGALPDQQPAIDAARDIVPNAAPSSVQVSPGSYTVEVGGLRNSVSLSTLPQTIPRSNDQERMTASYSHTPPRVVPHRSASPPYRVSMCKAQSPRESLAASMNQYSNVSWNGTSSPRLGLESLAVRSARENSLPRSHSAPGVPSPSQTHARRLVSQSASRAMPRQITVGSSKEISPRMFAQMTGGQTATTSTFQFTQQQHVERMCRGSSAPAFRTASGSSLSLHQAWT